MAPTRVDPVRLTQLRVELGPGSLLLWDLWLQVNVASRLWGNGSGRRKKAEPVSVRRSCPVHQGVRLHIGLWATCALAWGWGTLNTAEPEFWGRGRLIPAWTSMWSVAHDDQCRGWSGGAGLLGGIRPPAPGHAYRDAGRIRNYVVRRWPMAVSAACSTVRPSPGSTNARNSESAAVPNSEVRFS